VEQGACQQRSLSRLSYCTYHGGWKAIRGKRKKIKNKSHNLSKWGGNMEQIALGFIMMVGTIAFIEGIRILIKALKQQ